MKYLIPKFLFIVTLIPILGCSLAPLPQTVEIKLRLSEGVSQQRSNQSSNLSLPTGAGSFDCYFARVSADDITNELSKADDLNNKMEASCLGGRVSSMVSGSNFFSASNGGVAFSVLTGKGRKVSIYGIMTELGSACDSKPVRDAFKSTMMPSIYKVGESTEVEIVSGGTITVSTVFDANIAQEDLVGSCGPTIPLYLAGLYSGVDPYAGAQFRAMDSVLPPVVGGNTLTSSAIPSSAPLLKVSHSTPQHMPVIVAVFGIPQYALDKFTLGPTTTLQAQVVAKAGQLRYQSGACDNVTEPSGDDEFDLRVLNIVAGEDSGLYVTSTSGVFSLSNLASAFSSKYLFTKVNIASTDTNLIQTNGKIVNANASGQYIRFAIKGNSSASFSSPTTCGGLWLKSIRAYISP